MGRNWIWRMIWESNMQMVLFNIILLEMIWKTFRLSVVPSSGCQFCYISICINSTLYYLLIYFMSACAS